MKTILKPLLLVGATLLAAFTPAVRAQNYNTVSSLTFGTYLDTNGVTQPLKLDLYLPTNSAGPFPVVVYIFGGGWQGGSRAIDPVSSQGQPFLGIMGRGYALAAVDYRLSGAAKWPAQIHDVRGAVRWLRANAATYNLDPKKFGAWGFSSGAHLAEVLGLADAPSSTVGNTTVNLQGNIGGNLNFSDRVQAVCDWFGPSDLLRMNSYFTVNLTNVDASTSAPSLFIGATIQTAPELTSTASPLTYVHAGCPPFLLIHGTIDGTVAFNQSEIFNDALTRVGADVTFMANFGANHGAPTNLWNSTNLNNAVYRFFDRTLKGITTNALPVPVMTVSTNSGYAPLTVTFNATNSFDPDGSISFVAWAFGDDTGGTNNGIISHTYTSPGIYTATLCVRDDAYGLRSTNVTIIVNQPIHLPDTPPQIALTSPTTNSVQLAPGAVYLQASVTPGSSAITNVAFALDGVILGHDFNAPYGLTVGNLSAGHHTAQARATDANGLGANSALVGFEVFTNQFSSLVVQTGGTNFFAVQFNRVPAATNLTHTVDTSPDLVNWSSGSIYAFTGSVTNSAVTAQFSRTGTNVETVIVRDALPMNAKSFLRVRVTTQ